jgi:hypothetical protein
MAFMEVPSFWRNEYGFMVLQYVAAEKRRRFLVRPPRSVWGGKTPAGSARCVGQIRRRWTNFARNQPVRIDPHQLLLGGFLEGRGVG